MSACASWMRDTTTFFKIIKYVMIYSMCVCAGPVHCIIYTNNLLLFSHVMPICEDIFSINNDITAFNNL